MTKVKSTKKPVKAAKPVAKKTVAKKVATKPKQKAVPALFKSKLNVDLSIPLKYAKQALDTL